MQKIVKKYKVHISIMGQGSTKDSEREIELLNSGDPRFAHYASPLHIRVDTVAPAHVAHSRLAGCLRLFNLMFTLGKESLVEQELADVDLKEEKPLKNDTQKEHENSKEHQNLQEDQYEKDDYSDIIQIIEEKSKTPVYNGPTIDPNNVQVYNGPTTSTVTAKELKEKNNNNQNRNDSWYFPNVETRKSPKLNYEAVPIESRQREFYFNNQELPIKHPLEFGTSWNRSVYKSSPQNPLLNPGGMRQTHRDFTADIPHHFPVRNTIERIPDRPISNTAPIRNIARRGRTLLPRHWYFFSV